MALGVDCFTWLIQNNGDSGFLNRVIFLSVFLKCEVVLRLVPTMTLATRISWPGVTRGFTCTSADRSYVAISPTFEAINMIKSANCLTVVGLSTMLARRHRISRCTKLRLLSSP